MEPIIKKIFDNFRFGLQLEFTPESVIGDDGISVLFYTGEPSFLAKLDVIIEGNDLVLEYIMPKFFSGKAAEFENEGKMEVSMGKNIIPHLLKWGKTDDLKQMSGRSFFIDLRNSVIVWECGVNQPNNSRFSKHFINYVTEDAFIFMTKRVLKLKEGDGYNVINKIHRSDKKTHPKMVALCLLKAITSILARNSDLKTATTITGRRVVSKYLMEEAGLDWDVCSMEYSQLSDFISKPQYAVKLSDKVQISIPDTDEEYDEEIYEGEIYDEEIPSGSWIPAEELKGKKFNYKDPLKVVMLLDDGWKYVPDASFVEGGKLTIISFTKEGWKYLNGRKGDLLRILQLNKKQVTIKYRQVNDVL